MERISDFDEKFIDPREIFPSCAHLSLVLPRFRIFARIRFLILPPDNLSRNFPIWLGKNPAKIAAMGDGLKMARGNLNRAVDMLLAGEVPSAPAAPPANTNVSESNTSTGEADSPAPEPKDASEKKND